MIYGYANKKVDQYGLLELKEVTFAVEPGALRKIAGFLTSMADAMDAGQFRTDHRHIGEVDRSWSSKRMSCDIIVSPPLHTAD